MVNNNTSIGRLGSGISIADGVISVSGQAAEGEHWISVASGYTATPASTSTLTMTTDLTGTIKAGYGIKFTIGGTVYYGIVTAITSNLLTIAGAPLSGDVSAVRYTKTGVVQIPMLIPGYYEDATDATLLINDLGQTLLWQQGPAYLVRMGLKSRVADSSVNGIAQVYIGGNAVCTANSSAGLTLAGTGWYYSVIDISTTYYGITFGTAIEIGATKGTGGNAQDLSILLTFVVV